jgi:hypothetical protein
VSCDADTGKALRCWRAFLFVHGHCAFLEARQGLAPRNEGGYCCNPPMLLISRCGAKPRETHYAPATHPAPRNCLEIPPWHLQPDSLHARHGHTTSITFCRSDSVNQKAGRQRNSFRRLVRLCPVRDCRCVGRSGAIQTRQLNPKTFRGRSRVCTDGEEDRILRLHAARAM